MSGTRTFSSVIHLHKPIVKQAIEDLVRDGLFKPVGFVVDMFCAEMVDLANEMNVPTYLFFTSGASFLNFLLYAQSLADDRPEIDIVREFSRRDFSALVPGFQNPVTSNVIPALLQEKSGCELLLNFARKFREMKGILVNTYAELEPYGLQALAKGDGKRIPPVYPVGPILELHKKSGRGTTSMDESVIQWLDAQPESSVVFLCFGSWGSFDEEQIKEIANGLEQSGHRFLWALRKPPPKGKLAAPSDNEPYVEGPPGRFLERTSGRGKIVAWAPQVEVLAHRAIGGFVSHCGWNSTLESLWFGVPMATWPMYAEQQMNAFELVKDLNLAVEIRMDYKRDLVMGKSNFAVTAEEIENGVKTLMNADGKLRSRVTKMSEEGRKALEEGGSSHDNLEHFIEDVLQ
uniref:Glycosyltransferase n=1 Tax=Dianthus caryophyllus TaxID=3570 RepID=Q60FF1_DIACA|nr:UDP-glucose:flavonol 3-O-glucosyltransferase [Dianthus caryophyllus]